MPRATAVTTDDHAIRQHAYFLWENDGRPFGRDAEYWMRAVSDLTPKPKTKRAAADAPAPRSRQAPAKEPAPKASTAKAKRPAKA